MAEELEDIQTTDLVSLLAEDLLPGNYGNIPNPPSLVTYSHGDLLTENYKVFKPSRSCDLCREDLLPKLWKIFKPPDLVTYLAGGLAGQYGRCSKPPDLVTYSREDLLAENYGRVLKTTESCDSLGGTCWPRIIGLPNHQIL
ncbi:hypothetical protein NPIL_79291 [Nephila pilipes]|uniref:Uncharacterized protein n=1 Tax=Nephila pilipes TaxID=299642 RepID=A0A8X6P026_NEPPI|nr:hypothetical protein NPIL_79291 [Nephila pilipes]